MKNWDIEGAMAMEHTAENHYMSISFDTVSAVLISLKNKITGDEYIKKRILSPIISVFCIADGAGAKDEFVPAAIKKVTTVDEGEHCVIIGIEGFKCADKMAYINVEVTVKLCDKSPESLWSLKLKNNDPHYNVVEILFPYFRGIYLGNDWFDDTLIYPHHAGEKTINPIKAYASDRYLNFSRAQTMKDGDIFYREINYCGLASMSWMYYYDKDNGLYFGSHDSEFPLTGLRVETGGPDNPWMGFGIRKYKRISAGTELITGQYVIALTDKDWHWGAKRYREWIDGIIDMPENPDYLRNEFVLNQCYNFKRDGIIFNKFKDIPKMYKDGVSEYDAHHMFIASWNRKGFDQNYPEYYPDMELGTPWQLYEGCKYVNEHDGFVTFYINSRIFDIYSDYFTNIGRKWAIKDQVGDMIHEQYGPHKFVVMCPAFQEWQDYLVDIASWMVRCYGASGIYLDQLGSAEPLPCYDSVHAHEDIGDFNRGYLQILKKLLPRIRSMNPRSFLMIENCGDIYGGYVWGNLTWNGEPYDEFFNLYKYTFPEYVQVNMVNPKVNLSGDEKWRCFRMDIARAMLLGSVFWVGLDKFDGDDEYSIYVKKALALRRRLNEYVKMGKYLDTEGILAISGDIDVSHWVFQDGDMYIISNLNRTSDAFFEVPQTGADMNITCEDMDGGKGKAVRYAADGCIRVNVSESEISYIVVTKR
jgi:hypothetical protein